MLVMATIYAFAEADGTIVYVGQTCQLLRDRLHEHKRQAKLTPHRPLYSWWNDRGGPPRVLVLDQKAVEEGDSWPRDRETELIAAHVSKSLLNYHNRPKPPKRVIVKYWGTPCVRGHVVDGKTQRYAKNDSCVCCALERRAGNHTSDMRCVGWNASRAVAVS